MGEGWRARPRRCKPPTPTLAPSNRALLSRAHLSGIGARGRTWRAFERAALTVAAEVGQIVSIGLNGYSQASLLEELLRVLDS